MVLAKSRNVDDEFALLHSVDDQLFTMGSKEAKTNSIIFDFPNLSRWADLVLPHYDCTGKRTGPSQTTEVPLDQRQLPNLIVNHDVGHQMPVGRYGTV